MPSSKRIAEAEIIHLPPPHLYCYTLREWREALLTTTIASYDAGNIVLLRFLKRLPDAH